MPKSLGNKPNNSQQTGSPTSGSAAQPAPRPSALTEAAESTVTTAAKEDSGSCVQKLFRNQCRHEEPTFSNFFLEDSPGKDERISMSTCSVSGLWLNSLPSFQK